MRTLTRRGLLTGVAVLAVKPLVGPPVTPLTQYAHGFTLADVTSAVDALKAANVPALEGYYQLFIPPGIRHLFDLPLEERIAAGWVLAEPGRSITAPNGSHDGESTVEPWAGQLYGKPGDV